MDVGEARTGLTHPRATLFLPFQPWVLIKEQSVESLPAATRGGDVGSFSAQRSCPPACDLETIEMCVIGTRGGICGRACGTWRRWDEGGNLNVEKRKSRGSVWHI